MVQGVGGAGEAGSLKNIDLYNQYYQDYLQYNKDTGGNLSFQAYLTLKGASSYLMQNIENYIETGDTSLGDGKEQNTISIDRHVESGNNSIYQAQDEDTYYEFNFETGSYVVLHGKDAAAKALGLSDDTTYDMINFGYKTANIVDYTFGNLDDGQDKTVANVGGAYNGVTYTQQEFDLDYILNSLLMNPNDPQYQTAKEIFDNLSSNVNQWLPATDLDELNQVATDYGTNSAEYKSKLKELILANLDQAQEWVDDHNHVKYTATVTDSTSTDTDSSTNTDSTASTEGTVPEYDLDNILQNSGLLKSYMGNENWYGDKHYDNGSCRESSLNDARTYVDGQLTNVMNAYITELGSSCTDDMKKYLLKAKTQILQSDVIDYDSFGHGLFQNYGERAQVNIKNMVDKFKAEFDAMCKNNGKTDEEVAADKKAAEEKAAAEKTSYQTLYNTNFQSVAKEAGSDKDVQAVNVNSASEIQAKAETSVIAPLKSLLLSKYKGTIPDKDMQTILDNAATTALSDCTSWASTSNNYVYDIDASKLIDLFQTNVKELINAKGYSF